MTSLRPEDGLLRARLSEPQWRRVFDAAGSPDGLGAGLAPLVAAEEAAGALPDETTRAVVRDLLGAPIRAQVMTSHRTTGCVGSFAIRAASVVSLTRALGAVPGAAQEPGAVPGVELAAFGPERLVDQLMRHVPPAVQPWRDAESVTLPAEHATATVRALKSGDFATAETVLRGAGVASTPYVLEQLTDVRGDATILVVRRDGRSRFLRLLLTPAGWVRLSVGDAGVSHAPVDRAQIVEALTWALGGALEHLLAEGA